MFHRFTDTSKLLRNSVDCASFFKPPALGEETLFLLCGYIILQIFCTQVAISNKQCLNQGGSSCLLNYEKQKSHIIRVKTTDDGNPQLSYEANFRIDVRDINDMPRDLQLSNNQVKEDAKINTLIGR